MKKYNKKFLILVLISCLIAVNSAHAVSKLEATGPAADKVNKLEKIKEKYEDIQSKVLKEKEKWTKKANSLMDKTLGTEGASLFKQYVVKPGAGIVESAAKGQFNAGDFSLTGFTNAIKSDLGNYKLDYATLTAQSKDIIESMEKQKKEKEFAMEKQITKLKAEWEAKNKLNAELKSEELAKDLDEIAKQIASLEEQKAKLSNEIVMESEKQEKLKEQMANLQKSMADINSKISQEELLKNLNKEAMSLFTMKMADEDTNALYAENLDKLFLGKYDFGTSANMAKLRKTRRDEYFNSEKDLARIIVDTYKSIDNTEEHMKKCTQASAEAQALFGAAAMRVCIDIQIAKIGAQYMEMLLAQMHQESSLEIQKWTDKYKLPDYNRNYTEFNLDDYVLTKDDLKKKLKDKVSGAIGGAMMNFKGF